MDYWMLDVNPFVYSHPVAPEDVIDRHEETRALLKNAVGGHYVRVFAPRKYGKTSLLRRALQDGESRERLIPILVDLYRISSVADVAIRFERAYARQLKGTLRAKIEADRPRVSREELLARRSATEKADAPTGQ